MTNYCIEPSIVQQFLQNQLSSKKLFLHFICFFFIEDQQYIIWKYLLNFRFIVW
jgi:hypothetical protein